jgi:hypothetical protein
LLDCKTWSVRSEMAQDPKWQNVMRVEELPALGRHSLQAGVPPTVADSVVASYGILHVSFRSPSLFYLLTAGVEVVYFHLITLRHTPQSVGLLWTRDRPDAETST